MSENRTGLLLIFRRAPYGSGLARAAYDLALAAAAFEQEVSLLFMDDGVWQLLSGQQPQAIQSKSISRTLASLPLYDIETLYVEDQSLQARGLSQGDLEGETRLVRNTELGEFMDGFKQVISF